MDSETKGMMVTEVAVTDKEIKVTWTDANGDVKRVSSEDMPTKEFEEQLIKMAELLGKHLVLPEGRISVGRADGTRFNRWYVDAEKLDAEKALRNSVDMDLQEGDVIVIPGVTSFRVAKDNFDDDCCDYCSLGLKNPNRCNALPFEKLRLLCLM